MSAIAEGVEDGPTPVIKVLFALYPNFGAQEVVGAYEVLNKALQDLKKSGESSSQLPQPNHFSN